MDDRNVFRKRTAITPHQSKLRTAESIVCSQETVQKKQAKFIKTNEMKHVLLRGSQDQEFLKVVDDIKERKGTFYRMGFRSYEKKENRKVFGDVLGLDTNRSKGAMFVGQLWSNREHTRFLKENRIFMNKVKLIDKFQNIRKDLKEAEKDIFHSEMQEIDSNHSNEEIKDHLASTVSCTRRAGSKKYCIAQNLEEINSGLKQLKKNNSMNSLIGDVRKDWVKFNDIIFQKCFSFSDFSYHSCCSIIYFCNQRNVNEDINQINANNNISVEGLFADKDTDQIIYKVYANGKYSYQNRKWVMLNCKLELIKFYQRCVVIKDK